MSSLHGKASSTCVLEAGPGKLDIKSGEPGVLFISLPIVSLFFKLAIMTLLSTLVSASSRPDKGTCHEIDNVYQAMCTNAVNMRGS